jgi:polyisoprenoid-binding protein YceI
VIAVVRIAYHRVMQLPTGTFTLSNENGNLTIRTSREGLGARAGHDLKIQATHWEAIAESEGTAPKVKAEVDAKSLQILEGTGGVKPLTDGDRADIKTDLEKKILESDRYPRIAFQATGWQVLSDDPTHTKGRLSGELELRGQRSPLELEVDLQRADGAIRVSARGAIVQSRWGIKPYTAFLGALKVADPVQVEVEGTVPAG